MLGEPENQFFLTRVAPSTRRAQKQFLININNFIADVFCGRTERAISYSLSVIGAIIQPRKQ